MMPDPDAIWDYADDLQRYASYLCRDTHDAEDIAHTTLMKAAEHLDGFRGEASVRTWLHTIATNECRMLRRKARPDSLDRIVDASGEITVDRSDAIAQPEDAAIEAEARRTVVAALERLPLRYQQVLVLKDGCGLRAAEIARVLDTTVPSTKSILFRARRGLRSELEHTLAS